MTQLILSFLAFDGTRAWAELGQRDLPLFKPARMGLNLEFQSFKSTENYLSDGERESLAAGNEFRSYDLLLSATYDVSELWAFTAGLGVAYGESYDGDYRRSSRRFKNLNLGAYRRIPLLDSVSIVPDAHVFINLTSNDMDDDEVSVSDGVAWGQMGLWWVHELPDFFAYSMYAGYRARSNNYSHLFIYKIGPEFNFGRFGVGANLSGYMTIKDDSADPAALSERQQINTFYNAGSLRYNAQNPHLEELAIWASFELERMSFLKVGVNQVLGVENTADGFGILVELQSSFRVDHGGLVFPYFTKTMKRNTKEGHRALLKNLGPAPAPKPAVSPVLSDEE